MICEYGCGSEATKRFKSGKYCCSDNTSHCMAMRKQNNNKLSINIDNIDWQSVQEDYNSGLSQNGVAVKYNIPVSSVQKAVKQKLLTMRSSLEGARLSTSQGRTLSVESRTKMSDAARIRIIARYEAGWMPKAGRCKKYNYNSLTAGEVYLDGTWELEVAKWLDCKNYTWKRNTKRFQYINLKGCISHYTPDFWVSDLNSYIEIKGYETELDRCKWSQFTEPLIVWKRKELIELNILKK